MSLSHSYDGIGNGGLLHQMCIWKVYGDSVGEQCAQYACPSVCQWQLVVAKGDVGG